MFHSILLLLRQSLNAHYIDSIHKGAEVDRWAHAARILEERAKMIWYALPARDLAPKRINYLAFRIPLPPICDPHDPKNAALARGPRLSTTHIHANADIPEKFFRRYFYWPRDIFIGLAIFS